MALVNPNNNTWRSMAIAFLVLVMVSACTLPSCHAAPGDRYCTFLPPDLPCDDLYCIELCSRRERGSVHYTFCTHPWQCCCFTY
uniref:Predicted protein n=1 Tax=Hordeum vulgare subsp. vulgare TaxID=112509 RepID=F2E9D0_HORVV|nr:predicted protein [Hordeum vulgare subsp. vulgare]